MYYPDKWVVIKFNIDGKLIFKVLGSWYGGFTSGDSWRLNSGITEITSDDTNWVFHGHSGSTYVCNKECYGMSSYTSRIYEHMKEHYENIELVKEEDISSIKDYLEQQ